MQEPIERAIKIMWERYDEPLSLDELASNAHLSRFYFSRLFRSTTGTSPGRFLTAVRLYQAKLYLRETTWSVTEIAYQVGYSSLGTFISRFTRSVGASPGRYRRMARLGMPLLTGPETSETGPSGTIRGRLTLPALDTPVCVYVGLFENPVVEGLPMGCTVLEESGDFTIPDVPAGEWFLRAAAIGTQSDFPAKPQLPLAVGACNNLKIARGETVTANVSLHATNVFHMPILFALPALDTSLPRGGRHWHPRMPSQMAA